MKKRKVLVCFCLLLLLTLSFVSVSFGYDISEISLITRGISIYSHDHTLILNRSILSNYFVATYGDPLLIKNNRFTEENSGWAKYSDDDARTGEFQYLGFNFSGEHITNDRWFSKPGQIGSKFNPDYSSAIWHDIGEYQGLIISPYGRWNDLRIRNPQQYLYIINAPFFDSDHISMGERPTGETLRSLLPDEQWMKKSYLLSQPTQFEDGVVYLRYTKNGIPNYNTIQIPALPRVDCMMTATPDIMAIEKGKTSDVVVTIDTGGSYALMYHEKHPEEISSREYWAQTGPIPSQSSGTVTNQSVQRITIPNVSPNTTIFVKAAVSSDKVRQMNQPHEDSRTAEIFIGELPVNDGGIVGAPVSPGTPTGTPATPGNPAAPGVTDPSSVSGTMLEAGAKGILRSFPRDAEVFDVTKGIPSTEFLYAQVDGRQYLIRQEFSKVTGTITYNVSVDYPSPAVIITYYPTGSPTPIPATSSIPTPIPSSIPSSIPPSIPSFPPTSIPTPSPPQRSSTTVSVTRSYEYWEISRLEVFTLESATIESKALPGGMLKMMPAASYHAPVVHYYHKPDDVLTYHVSTGSLSRSTSASSSGSDAIHSAAEGAVPPLTVRNDKLIIDGSVVLKDTPSSGSTNAPAPAAPGMISRDTLYVAKTEIPEALVNGTYSTTGTIMYARIPDAVINGGAQTVVEVPIPDANGIVVHTPVALGADLVSDEAHNQSTQLDVDRASLVLGRPFTIRVTDVGQHLALPGYGSRDYAAYASRKQIRLSFDAYHGALYTGKYLQSGKWYDLKDLNGKSSPALAFGPAAGMALHTTPAASSLVPSLAPGLAPSIAPDTRGVGTLYEFKVPVWVQPGAHTVEVRTTARNDAYSGTRVEDATANMTTQRLYLNGSFGASDSGNTTIAGANIGTSTPRSANEQLTGQLAHGHAANTNPLAHAVSVEIPVHITGRLYDFQITDIQDPMWETFFRTATNSAQSTGKRLDTGTRNINGDVDANRKFLLPAMPGRNDVVGYQDRAVKLGYKVRFELKSVGPFFDALDAVRLHPTFHYVDKTGANRQEVDLYYSLPTKPMIRVGSAEDTLIGKAGIDLKWRNLSSQELLDAGNTLWELQGGVAGYATREAFAQAFLKQAQAGTDMFRTWRVLLGNTTRLFRGPVDSSWGATPGVSTGFVSGFALPGTVDPALSHASMQKWYGEWALPADTLIVPKGTDLSTQGRLSPQHPVFLKDGYLVANFRDIELVRSGDFLHPVLQYGGRTDVGVANGRIADATDLSRISSSSADDGNGWLLEGYSVAQGNWDLREGDAVVFYANRRSTDDLMGQGTH